MSSKIAQHVQLDVADLPLFSGQSIYVGTNGYAYVSAWRTGPQTVHSVVMGGARQGMHIDHINGDKLDNRRENLRFVSTQANQVNRKRRNSNNTSGARGVTVRAGANNPFIAQISAHHRCIYLGSFRTLEQAVAARKAAELRYFGEECP